MVEARLSRKTFTRAFSSSSPSSPAEDTYLTATTMSISFSFTAPRMEPEAAQEEFESLPKAERDHAIEDVQGTNCFAGGEEEEPTASSLRELRTLLQAETDSSANQHYRNALDRCPDYVGDDDFLLLFLRAKCFDVKSAQSCLYEYWKQKEILFGERAYGKLTAENLRGDDLEPCRANCFYFMPHQDRAGRGIVISIRPRWSYGGDWRNMARWIWYCKEAMLENTLVQMNGFVSISCNDGPSSVEKFDRKFHKWLTNMMKGVFFPSRCVAAHLCYDSKLYGIILPLILPMMGQRMRSRLRLYPGSKSHTRLEKFKECSLEKEMLPTILGGKVNFGVNEWLESRRDAGQ